MRFRRDSIPELSKVNHFYCPAGKWPFKGWVLLPRYEYDQLDPYSINLQLNVGNTEAANNVSTLKHLTVVQAQCATRGMASDPNALYLIEITDRRGVLCNEWFHFPTSSSYNIRAPAYPQTFLTSSMNGGTTWTWSTMLQDLWEQMEDFLGPWPGLPLTPDGTPEGFHFTGVPAWLALCNVLDHLGMTVACDLTQANPYTIVYKGDEDASLALLKNRYLSRLEDDLEWLDTGSGRVPKTVRVFFRRRNEFYGTEETIRRDSLQWMLTPLYSVDVTAPAAYTSAVGMHYLWDDFTVRYDVNNNPIADDVTKANAIAQQRATQYYERIDVAQYLSQTYAGALPFVTGSKLDGVCYYLRDGGWRTQIVNGYAPPWPDIWKE